MPEGLSLAGISVADFLPAFAGALLAHNELHRQENHGCSLCQVAVASVVSARNAVESRKAATPKMPCMEPSCILPVNVQITGGKGRGYCYEHRQKGFDYNRGMA